MTLVPPRARSSRVRSTLLGTVLPHAVILGLLLAFWSWLTRPGGVPSVVMPSPSRLAEAIIDVVQARWFLDAVRTTAFEAIMGLLLATIVGVGLGLVLGTFSLLGQVSQPFIVAFQVTPSVALAPIFIVWLGPGVSSKVVLAFTISFFVILVNTLEGVRRVPANSRRLMRSLGATRLRTLRTLTIPASLPYIFAGLRTAVTLALVGALVAEFVAARSGLGQKLIEFTFAIRTAQVWAILAVIGALGISMYGVVVALDRKIVWWRS